MIALNIRSLPFRPWRFSAPVLAVCALVGSLNIASAAEPSNWPSFRGQRASGLSEGHALPTQWDASNGVQWKTPIPGLGLGSPVIWGDKVFVTSAVSEVDKGDLKVGLYGEIKSVDDTSVHSWRVYCLDRKTGKVLWEQESYKGVPKIKRHTKSSHANSTPATDGQRVVAFFGSEGLYCYDMDGKLLWKKDLGVLDAGFYVVPDAQWEFGSSPIIHKDTVVVQCDVQKNSFLAAFDARDGKELWRTPREEVPTWSTPTIVEKDGKTLIFVNGYKHIGGYEFETGKEAWKLVGGGDIPVPTPVIAHDMAYITNAHGFMAPIYAVKTSASGTLPPPGGPTPSEHLAWFEASKGNYMQTPIVYVDWLFMCRDNGVLSCIEAKTGKQLFRERLGGGETGFTASGVGGDGKLYFTSEEGDVYVIKAGATFEQIAKNSLGEYCMATPAIAHGTIFFRTYRHVMAIGK